MNNPPYDVAVVGAGMMGSAAAKYLAQEGLQAVLVGAEEGNRQGVHASHYDQARITRYSGPDAIWSHLAARSIASYEDIESASGIDFHQGCGHLRCDLPTSHPDSTAATVNNVLAQMPVTPRFLTTKEVASTYPYLRFDPASELLYEPSPAGIIRPRDLIAAQMEVGKTHGLDVVAGVVSRIEPEDGRFALISDDSTIYAARVLLATGSYTSLMPLTSVDMSLEVRPETVLLARIDPDRHEVLMGMPGIIWNFDDHPEVPYAYVLPPVRYPDGHFYVKIGADHDKDVSLDSVADAHLYMSGEGSKRTAQLLLERLLALIPSLDGSSIRSKPCLLTYAPKGYPLIDEVEDGLFVLAGGCGKSAKSSDALGNLASLLITGKSWPEPFKRESFSVS